MDPTPNDPAVEVERKFGEIAMDGEYGMVDGYAIFERVKEGTKDAGEDDMQLDER